MLAKSLYFILLCVLLGIKPIISHANQLKIPLDTSINMLFRYGIGADCEIKIIKSDGSIKILYIVNVSSDTVALKADKEYRYLMKRFDSGKLFGKRSKVSEQIKFNNMFERHKVYSSDSISFTEASNPPFTTLIRTVVSKNIEELKKNKDGYIYLDCFSVIFKLIVSDKVKEFGVYCPDKRLEPLLVELISQTVAVYKTFSNKDLLSKTSIRGY